MDVHKAVQELLSSQLGIDVPPLEIPPSRELGDYAMPCFTFTKELQKSPQAIADDFVAQVSPETLIARVVSAGPYLNIFLDRDHLTRTVLSSPLAISGSSRTVLFEYPSPNTNKPLHLGHLRNMLLGSSCANINEAVGNHVVRTTINNDRGVHICKSILAYLRWGEGKTPADLGMKPDHFVGHWYVEFAKHAQKEPGLEAEAQSLLRKWEEGDEETLSFWQQMNAWAYEGWEETFRRVGIAYDKQYYESAFYEDAKEVVKKAYADGVFTKDEKGNIVVDLGTLGTKVVLRADGTSVYMTQDIGLATLRERDFHPDTQVYVVADEQNHHFKQLFAILKLLGYPHADKLYHLSYGMIRLTSGKMKSREGNVVDCDDILDEVEALAAEAVRERHEDLSDDEVRERARVIGLAAIKFFFLKYEPRTGFTYDPKESISFEGETGPYILYAVARINSILREEPAPEALDAQHILDDESYALTTLLRDTLLIVEEAAETHKPHLVARHALKIAQTFTAFYHEHKVLAEDKDVRGARLRLCLVTKQHLEYLLGLLGIGSLEEM